MMACQQPCADISKRCQSSTRRASCIDCGKCTTNPVIASEKCNCGPSTVVAPLNYSPCYKDANVSSEQTKPAQQVSVEVNREINQGRPDCTPTKPTFWQWLLSLFLGKSVNKDCEAKNEKDITVLERKEKSDQKKTGDKAKENSAENKKEEKPKEEIKSSPSNTTAEEGKAQKEEPKEAEKESKKKKKRKPKSRSTSRDRKDSRNEVLGQPLEPPSKKNPSPKSPTRKRSQSLDRSPTVVPETVEKKPPPEPTRPRTSKNSSSAKYLIPYEPDQADIPDYCKSIERSSMSSPVRCSQCSCPCPCEPPPPCCEASVTSLMRKRWPSPNAEMEKNKGCAMKNASPSCGAGKSKRKPNNAGTKSGTSSKPKRKVKGGKKKNKICSGSETEDECGCCDARPPPCGCPRPSPYPGCPPPQCPCCCPPPPPCCIKLSKVPCSPGSAGKDGAKSGSCRPPRIPEPGCPITCMKPCCVPIVNVSGSCPPQNSKCPSVALPCPKTHTTKCGQPTTTSNRLQTPVSTICQCDSIKSYKKSRNNDAFCRFLLSKYNVAAPEIPPLCPLIGCDPVQRLSKRVADFKPSECIGESSGNSGCRKNPPPPNFRSCSGGCGSFASGGTQATCGGNASSATQTHRRSAGNLQPPPQNQTQNYQRSKSPAERNRRDLVTFNASPCKVQPHVAIFLSKRTPVECIREMGTRNPTKEYLSKLGLPKKKSRPAKEVETPPAPQPTPKGKSQYQDKGKEQRADAVRQEDDPASQNRSDNKANARGTVKAQKCKRNKSSEQRDRRSQVAMERNARVAKLSSAEASWPVSQCNAFPGGGRYRATNSSFYRNFLGLSPTCSGNECGKPANFYDDCEEETPVNVPGPSSSTRRLECRSENKEVSSSVMPNSLSCPPQFSCIDHTSIARCVPPKAVARSACSLVTPTNIPQSANEAKFPSLQKGLQMIVPSQITSNLENCELSAPLTLITTQGPQSPLDIVQTLLSNPQTVLPPNLENCEQSAPTITPQGSQAPLEAHPNLDSRELSAPNIISFENPNLDSCEQSAPTTTPQGPQSPPEILQTVLSKSQTVVPPMIPRHHATFEIPNSHNVDASSSIPIRYRHRSRSISPSSSRRQRSVERLTGYSRRASRSPRRRESEISPSSVGNVKTTDPYKSEEQLDSLASVASLVVDCKTVDEPLCSIVENVSGPRDAIDLLSEVPGTDTATVDEVVAPPLADGVEVDDQLSTLANGLQLQQHSSSVDGEMHVAVDIQSKLVVRANLPQECLTNHFDNSTHSDALFNYCHLQGESSVDPQGYDTAGESGVDPIYNKSESKIGNFRFLGESAVDMAMPAPVQCKFSNPVGDNSEAQPAISQIRPVNVDKIDSSFSSREEFAGERQTNNSNSGDPITDDDITTDSVNAQIIESDESQQNSEHNQGEDETEIEAGSKPEKEDEESGEGDDSNETDQDKSVDGASCGKEEGEEAQDTPSKPSRLEELLGASGVRWNKVGPATEADITVLKMGKNVLMKTQKGRKGWKQPDEYKDAPASYGGLDGQPPFLGLLKAVDDNGESCTLSSTLLKPQEEEGSEEGTILSRVKQF